MGHFIGDPEVYRSADEVEDRKKEDPLPRFKRFLLESGILNEELDRQIKATIQGEAEEALEFAIASPEPELSQLKEDVYHPFRPL
jgi:pyruvate dehydrogenase E1 component alpha subunit